MGKSYKQEFTISVTVFDIDEWQELLRIKKIPLAKGIKVLDAFMKNKLG